MRRSPPHRTVPNAFKIRLCFFGCIAFFLAGLLLFSRYFNTEIKPTLHALAEYEAQRATVGAMNAAVQSTLAAQPLLCKDLYSVTETTVTLNTAAANQARCVLVAAVQEQMSYLPEHSISVPLGSLTNNSLLSGLGPQWKISLQPEGFVDSLIEEKAESLAINSTRYCAVLVLRVTFNMVLDSHVSAITVTNRLPLASVIVSHDAPVYYSD